ncbi:MULTISPECIES: hypothetical protein [unclassified Brevundimonas]|uniref:hypothetical protein n=1 Tax=unclassified Brevundimonas TaxID=2622653 RepID=UPI0012E3BFBA|nr:MULTISPECIES: hypothetical protein [unclassified Brevundimonas]
MTIRRRSPTISLFATVFAVAGVSACGAPPPMSVADHSFDKAISAALADGQPIAVTSMEPGGWTMVCVVGEQRPADMLPGQAALPGEEAFESLFDAAAYRSGPSSAFAFLYDEGVEMRPVNSINVNMGQPINRCVSREQAILVPDGEGGWRFRDFPPES